MKYYIRNIHTGKLRETTLKEATIYFDLKVFEGKGDNEELIEVNDSEYQQIVIKSLVDTGKTFHKLAISATKRIAESTWTRQRYRDKATEYYKETDICARKVREAINETLRYPV